jgi:hypothetical protein
MPRVSFPSGMWFGYADAASKALRSVQPDGRAVQEVVGDDLGRENPELVRVTHPFGIGHR